jgi:hypothetical protein
MRELQRVAVSRNRRRKITGALVYDDRWFAQALEGEIQFVEEILDSILRDTRHANVKITSTTIVSERLFARWSLGFAARKLETEPLFGLHWFSVSRNPSIIYPVHAITRKSFGDITRKLSVTVLLYLAQFRGTLSLRKSSVASANSLQVP